MKNISNEDLIFKYLDNQLNEQEELEFNYRFDNDAEFAEMLEDYAETEEFFMNLASVGREKDREEFFKLYDELSEKKPEEAFEKELIKEVEIPKIQKSRTLWDKHKGKLAIAASITIVILAWLAPQYYGAFRIVPLVAEADKQKELKQIEKKYAENYDSLQKKINEEYIAKSDVKNNYVKLEEIKDTYMSINDIKDNYVDKKIYMKIYEKEVEYERIILSLGGDMGLGVQAGENKLKIIEPNKKVIDSNTREEVYFEIIPINSEIKFVWQGCEFLIIDKNKKEIVNRNSVEKENETKVLFAEKGFYTWVISCDESYLKGGIYVY